MTKRRSEHPAARLPAFDPDSQALNVVIETPKGSRNKLAYDPDSWLYRLKAVLPEGASLPHAFGFVPSTLGEDGDPLDALVLMDDPVYPGCLVPTRLIGVIRASQVDRDGTEEENDRLVAVCTESHAHSQVRRPADLSETFRHEVEEFFVFYNKARGKTFKPRGWKGPRAAVQLVTEGQSRRRRRKRTGKSK